MIHDRVEISAKFGVEIAFSFIWTGATCLIQYDTSYKSFVLFPEFFQNFKIENTKLEYPGTDNISASYHSKNLFHLLPKIK